MQLPYLAVHHPLAHCLVLPLKEQPDNTTPRDATERLNDIDSNRLDLEILGWLCCRCGIGHLTTKKGAMSGKAIIIEECLGRSKAASTALQRANTGLRILLWLPPLDQHERWRTTGTAQQTHQQPMLNQPTCCLLVLLGLTFKVHPRQDDSF